MIMKFKFADVVRSTGAFYNGQEEQVLFTIVEGEKKGKGVVYKWVINMNVPEQFRIVELKESEIEIYVAPEPEVIEPEGCDCADDEVCTDCAVMKEVDVLEEEVIDAVEEVLEEE